ncbi:hypothetical protein [Haloarcula sediminis]|uniref:hypothetical protein n=1 Tax=Haloarcula sediminis TaxID=3111777 RepID=UPI002D772EDF|nr:hypothetical protein [Haloarcula sp. CK38]
MPRDRLEDGYDGAKKRGNRVRQSTGGWLRRGMMALRSGLGRLWGLVLALLLAPFRLLGFGTRQVRGTRDNVGRAWNYLTFDNVLPPSLTGLIQWFIETIPKVFGVRDTTPWQQLGAAMTVIIFAIIGTVASGGLLIGIVIGVGVLGLIGLARHVPAVNQGWNRITGKLPIRRDYDVPRWKRD